jgi:HPt (histidine-containing phosphotransfer) domain-containing protein
VKLNYKRDLLEPVPNNKSKQIEVMKVIDELVLQELKDMAGDDYIPFLTEVVDAFVNDTSLGIDKMTLAIEQENPSKLEEVAHGIKSASAYLGAKQLSHLCQELEILGRSGTIAGAPEIFHQLRQEYARVETALLSECQK